MAEVPMASTPAPPGGAASSAAARRTFFAFWALYLLFAWPGPPFDLVALRYLVLGEQYARGRISFHPEERHLGVDILARPRPDGTYPPTFQVGLAVLATPLCGLALAADRGPVTDDPAEAAARRQARLFAEALLVLVLIVAPAGAGCVVVLARLLERLDAPLPWPTSVLVGLGLLFPLATTVNPHPVAALAVLAGIGLASPDRRPLVRGAGGFLVGAGVLLDHAMALTTPIPIAAWLLWRDRRAAWAFLAGAGVALALQMLKNALYFGHPLRTMAPMEDLTPSHREIYGFISGSIPLHAIALPELLIGGRTGLLVFSPITILGLLGLPALWRHRRDVALLVIVVSTLSLAQAFATGPGYIAGTQKGPRYLTSAAMALGVPAAFGLARWPRLGLGLGLVGAAISWIQAQTPFYGELRSAITDVLAFGPRLRLLHSVGELVRPGRDLSQALVPVSLLLALPVLLFVLNRLVPPARQRLAAGVVVGAWAACALVSQTIGPWIAPDRTTIRTRELCRQIQVEPYPIRLVWYGQELLGLGYPAESCLAFLRALEQGGWGRDEAREGLADAVRALARTDPAAALRVLARAQALKPASEAAPVGSN